MRKLIIVCLLCIVYFTGCSTKNNNEVHKIELSSGDFIDELALHDAIRAKDIKIVEELLQSGIQIDTKDAYGYTPLHLAVRYDMYAVVDMLIAQEANVNNFDRFNDTPLLDSTRNSTNDISRLLLCNGADTEVSDNHKMKPLHNASKNEDIYIVKLIQSDRKGRLCEKLDITLDSFSRDDNQVCGSIVKGIADEVLITITQSESENVEPLGEYDASITNNKYCANLDFKPKKSKEYIVTARAKNQIEQDTEVNALDNIITKTFSQSLYDDLMKEFAQDFDKWNAELVKEGLKFRFKKPEVLFNVGSSDIKDNFLEILVDFFPRYMKVIEPYKNDIQKITVEGHTSSEFRIAKNDEERYSKNLELSQSRAQEVYTYTYNQNSELVISNKEWLTSHYSFVGKAYDELIYDENGNENVNLSRRVEFTILETNKK